MAFSPSRRLRLDRPILLVLCGLTLSKVSRIVSVSGAPHMAPSFVLATHPVLRKEPKNSLQLSPRQGGNSFSFFTMFKKAFPFAYRAGSWWRARMLPQFWCSSGSRKPDCISTGFSRGSENEGVKKLRTIRKVTPLQSAKPAVHEKSNSDSVPNNEGMNGIFAVHKPKNWTSFDVVGKIRSTLGKKLREDNPSLSFKQCRIKVGHGGTLDPDATGVLVIGIGRGTKSMDLYTRGSKVYEAVGVFGYETDTGDAQGTQVGEVIPHGHVDQATLEKALATLEGDIMQVPPVYSAIKIDGKRAYDLARKGVEVEMAARPAKVYSFRLTRPFAETAPEFHVRIECGGGTYVRSLIRDAARAAGCAAHMRALVRTKQGRFELSDCLPDDAFNDAPRLLAAVARCAPLAETI